MSAVQTVENIPGCVEECVRCIQYKIMTNKIKIPGTLS